MAGRTQAILLSYQLVNSRIHVIVKVNNMGDNVLGFLIAWAWCQHPFAKYLAVMDIDVTVERTAAVLVNLPTVRDRVNDGLSVMVSSYVHCSNTDNWGTKVIDRSGGYSCRNKADKYPWEPSNR